jgi:hypothetical protein
VRQDDFAARMRAVLEEPIEESGELWDLACEIAAQPRPPLDKDWAERLARSIVEDAEAHADIENGRMVIK